LYRYLVVANQTLGGQELQDVFRDRMARGPAQFWVVAPATPATQLITDFGALGGAFPVDPSILPTAAEIRDEGVAVARANLDTELARLHELGAVADGAVGDPNPMTAIEKAIGEQQFDEIILSTLPTGISRWLALDLPHRIRRKFDIPLTVVTAPR
jgi:GABA permease